MSGALRRAFIRFDGLHTTSGSQSAAACTTECNADFSCRSTSDIFLRRAARGGSVGRVNPSRLLTLQSARWVGRSGRSDSIFRRRAARGGRSGGLFRPKFFCSGRCARWSVGRVVPTQFFLPPRCARRVGQWGSLPNLSHSITHHPPGC